MTYMRHGPPAIRTPESERGIALPMVLLALVVLSVVAVTSIQIAGQEKQAGGGSLQTTKAFYTAEAGLHSVIASWDSARYDTMTALAGAGDSLSLGKQLIPENGQVYHPMIHHLGDSASKQYRITSQVWDAAASRWGRRVAVTVSRSNPSYVFLTNDLDINNGTVFGNVRSNGRIALTGPLYGNAVAGGTIFVPTTVAEFVSGSATEGAPQIDIPDVPCPAGPYGPVPLGGESAFDAITGDFTMSGPAAATFTAGTYYFRNLTASNGPVRIPLGDNVEIYVSQAFSVSGSGFVNQNLDARTLKIYGCGTDVSDWKFGQDSDGWLQMKAPRHFLDMKNTGTMHGTFVASSIKKGGSSTLSFEGADAGGLAPVPGTWADLSD